jgi:glycosyltransferase involved in cell wall biosynthesis
MNDRGKIEKSTRVDIAVLVGVFNQKEILADCLNSIINQKVRNATFRIYIIDDASTDGSREVISEFAADYPKLVFPVLHSVNQFSQGKSPETPLLNEVDAEFLAFCDGDDFWIDEYKLEKQYLELIRNTSVNLVHTNYLIGRPDKSNLKFESRTDKDVSRARAVRSAQNLIQGNEIKRSTVMLRSSSLRHRFLMDAMEIQAQDWLVAICAGLEGQIVFLESPMAVYRISSNASYQVLNQDTKNRLKNEVRWYCATNLPEGKIRESFRSFLLKEHLRELIRISKAYQLIRPMVLLFRMFARKIQKW